jgi:hypoxanthine phosphoribosyltransferase
MINRSQSSKQSAESQPPGKPKALISASRIQSRVKSLAREIDKHYRGRHLVVIGVLNGSILFLADLIRQLKTPLHLDSIAASSYGTSLKSKRRVLFDRKLKLGIKGADVLLVDDILDSGRTISTLLRFLKSLKPRSLELCVLLEKKIPRKGTGWKPRFVGFRIPDEFVYGYGLDYAEKFRNLNHIAVAGRDEGS